MAGALSPEQSLYQEIPKPGASSYCARDKIIFSSIELRHVSELAGTGQLDYCKGVFPRRQGLAKLIT